MRDADIHRGKKTREALRRAFTTVLVALTIAGCTFSGVKPNLLGAAPATAPKTLVIGDVGVADPLWESYRLHFVRGVSEWLKRNGGFETVLTARPAVLATESITLTGIITEVDKGSTALRWIVGMGAGQAKVKGDFRLLGPDGAEMVKFTARESYLGGAGIGGAGFLDMEDLVRRFAETVAETTRKWTRGEKIDE